jgi:2-oxoglutarate dehydrogenase E2 component (dihydrolipoamide succinyltransferase)
MAHFEVVMPKLGESIIEATITKWIKKPGDTIEEDDPIVEIATDKVDSEIPSPVEGKLIEVKFQEGDVVEVGKVIAVIETDPGSIDENTESLEKQETETSTVSEQSQTNRNEADRNQQKQIEKEPETTGKETIESDRFYSPLVKNIAKTEGIPLAELEKLEGSGKDGRITKNDLLAYIEDRKSSTPESKPAQETKPEVSEQKQQPQSQPKEQVTTAPKQTPQVSASQGDEIVEMDRMRKLIADHMVMSKQVSPHVTSFIEVDVTNMVQWREKVKDEFFAREKEKITFTPIFVEAATQALKELPGVNASVDGYNVILRKNINVGIAAALPNGNLIVPVIKNADQKSLLGLAKDVNSLADKARRNKLAPDDIQNGTFTITNLGTFGSITGSPIINQPQVAILGLGVIKKKPVVLETPQGDVIAIRHLVILSLAYDHRVVDGALGGMFLQKVQQILERFDVNRSI